MEIQHCPTFALYWLKRPGWKAPFRVDLVKILNSTGLVCIATAKSEEARWVSRTWWDASISTLCLPGWEELAAHPVNQTLPDSPISQGQQRPSSLWPGAPRLTLSMPCFCGGTYSICSSSSLGASQLKLAGRAKAAKPLIQAEEWLHICSHAAHSYQGKTSTRERLLSQLQGKGLLPSWTFPAASNFTPVFLFCVLFVCFCFCSLFDLLCLHLECQLWCKHVLKGIWFYNIIMQTQSLRESYWKEKKRKPHCLEIICIHRSPMNAFDTAELSTFK